MPRMRREHHRDRALGEAVDCDARGWASPHASPGVPWHVLVHRLLVRGVVSAPPPHFEPVVWHFPSLDGCVLDFAAIPIAQLTWPPKIDKDNNMQTRLAPNYHVPPSHRYHRVLYHPYIVGSTSLLSYRFGSSFLLAYRSWRSLIYSDWHMHTQTHICRHQGVYECRMCCL